MKKIMLNFGTRPEALDVGTVILVGTNRDLIIKEVSLLIDDTDYYNKESRSNNPCEDSKACNQIVEQLKNNKLIYESIIYGIGLYRPTYSSCSC